MEWAEVGHRKYLLFFQLDDVFVFRDKEESLTQLQFQIEIEFVQVLPKLEFKLVTLDLFYLFVEGVVNLVGVHPLLFFHAFVDRLWSPSEQLGRPLSLPALPLGGCRSKASLVGDTTLMRSRLRSIGPAEVWKAHVL